MKLRVLGALGVLVLLLVVLLSTVILSSTTRELTQQLQINRATSLGRIAQLAFDAATESDTTSLQRDMDTYSGLYGEGLVVRLQEKHWYQAGSIQRGRMYARPWPWPA